jgi:hypothetical protein
MKSQICEHCHEPFMPSRGPSANRRQRFCGYVCRSAAISGPTHYNFKGGSVNRWGYRMVSVNGRRVREHRHVMEQIVGRPLLPDEVVHHIDHDKLNNAPGNLRLHPNRAIHSQQHVTAFRSQTHKECVTCHVVKPRSGFHRAAQPTAHHDTHHSQCKACRKPYYAQRNAARLTPYYRRLREWQQLKAAGATTLTWRAYCTPLRSKTR